VIGAITEQTTNTHYGWPIIVGLFVVAIIALCFVDMEAAKLEMLHIEIHQELIESMAQEANRRSVQQDRRMSFLTETASNEKVPIIRMELSSDGGSEYRKS
jgi:hypothetical protein